jgi:hypothetical protein
MAKTVVVKKDEETGEYYFDITELSDLFDDISIIDTYSIEMRDDKSIVVEFFDKDGKKVIPSKT